MLRNYFAPFPLSRLSLSQFFFFSSILCDIHLLYCYLHWLLHPVANIVLFLHVFASNINSLMPILAHLFVESCEAKTLKGQLQLPKGAVQVFRSLLVHLVDYKQRNIRQCCNSEAVLTLKVLNFWKLTSYCSSKPLWSGLGEVVPARTSPTLHPPSPSTMHQLSWLAL